jgi:hypothetical protein
LGGSESAPSAIGLITFGTKQTGKRSALCGLRKYVAQDWQGASFGGGTGAERHIRGC